MLVCRPAVILWMASAPPMTTRMSTTQSSTKARRLRFSFLIETHIPYIEYTLLMILNVWNVCNYPLHFAMTCGFQFLITVRILVLVVLVYIVNDQLHIPWANSNSLVAPVSCV